MYYKTPRNKSAVCLLGVFFIFFSCSSPHKKHIGKPSPIHKKEILSSTLETKRVIIIVIDGPRYSETWGDPSHKHMPELASIINKEGAVFTHFYNNGVTYTNPGHTAITTGVYQKLNNSGLELPKQPSIFQYWLEAYNHNKEKAWIITSKDKLEVLANTSNPKFNNNYNPSTNCGVNGLGSGYRSDSLTYYKAIHILKTHHPNLVLINFRQPDYYAHGGKWKNYLTGIRSSNKYTSELWQFIKKNPYYKNNTTVFITNDHGRHLNGIKDGFKNHGDDCEGCRHINLFILGPNIKRGVYSRPAEQVDIAPTVAKLLNFDLPYTQGKCLPIFK